MGLAPITLRGPGPAEVTVTMMAAGVCPTDLFGIDGGAGDRFPAVFGHEGAGVVEAVGSAVRGIVVGDHVVIGFASCQHCPSCLAGHPAYCARFAALNFAAQGDVAAFRGEPVSTGWMGQSSWSTRVVVDASTVARIGADVAWEVAATLGCGVLTGVGTVLNVLRPGADQSILVLGAGTTGLAAVMAAAHRGVARIVVSDPQQRRRELALGLGAHEAFDPADLGAAIDDGLRVSHALDTVGVQSTVDAAVAALAPRGFAATVALKAGANKITVSQSKLLWGRTLTGVIEGDSEVARDVGSLAALWRAGRLPVERIVVSYGFEDIATAVADVRSGAVVKPVLTFSAPPDQAPSPMPGDLAELLETGAVREADVARLWRTLPAVAPEDLRGLWEGTGLTPSHRAHAMLARHSWFGKLFRSREEVAPLVCRDGAGDLFVDEVLARGGARLIRAEHEGVVTAAMVYDGQPIVDFFVRVSEGAVLGVMTGRHVLHDGAAYYFLLRRADEQEVRVSGPSHATGGPVNREDGDRGGSGEAGK